MLELQLRYQKTDEYNNICFISNDMKDKKAYELLQKYYKQLNKQFPDLYLPIYYNEKFKYATIRFKYLPAGLNLNKNDVCSIKFNVKKRSKDDKTFINCVCKHIEVVERAVEEDTDEQTIELDHIV